MSEGRLGRLNPGHPRALGLPTVRPVRGVAPPQVLEGGVVVVGVPPEGRGVLRREAPEVHGADGAPVALLYGGVRVALPVTLRGGIGGKGMGKS